MGGVSYAHLTILTHGELYIWCSFVWASSADPFAVSSLSPRISSSTGSVDDPAFASDVSSSPVTGAATVRPFPVVGGHGETISSSSVVAFDTVAQEACTSNTNDQRSPLSFPEEWVCRPLTMTVWSRMRNGRLVPVIRNLPSA